MNWERLCRNLGFTVENKIGANLHKKKIKNILNIMSEIFHYAPQIERTYQ